MSDHQIRDLVHTIKSKDLTPAQIESAFGEIFLSKDTISNQLESQEIVSQFQTVKVPTFGAAIPNTTVIQTRTADSGIIPIVQNIPANKTYAMLAADAVNAGSGSVVVNLGYFDNAEFVKISEATPAASGGIGGFNLRNAFTFDSDCFPALLVTSGTASDVVVHLAYCEIVQ